MLDKAILMPSSDELEKKILGYLMVYPDEAYSLLVLLSPDYFWNNDYKHIFKKLCKMYLKWQEIDIVNINAELEKDDIYKKLWASLFIYDATDEVRFDSLSWAFEIAKRLKNLYIRRKIIREARNLEYYSINIEDIEEKVFDIYQNLNDILSLSENNITKMEDNIKLLEKSIELNKEKNLIWYSFGFEWLDKHTLWLRKWKTYRIWWLSWVWKTSFVYQVIKSLLEQEAKVLFISLENNIETTLSKFLSCVQSVSSKDIETWKIEADYEYLRKIKDNFIICDSLFYLNEIKREILKSKADVIILDYIGLVNIKWFTEETKYNEYADSMRMFVQQNPFFAFLDISNLWKADNEFTIREYKAYNWSAKLRNNADFWMHIFPYSNFEKFKNRIMKNWTEKQKAWLYWKKVSTFFYF